MVLSGEADLTSAGRVSELLAAQLAAGTQDLRIDVSGLRFADSATVRALVLAARTLRERQGSLILIRPQSSVVRVLELMGATQALVVQGAAEEAERRP